MFNSLAFKSPTSSLVISFSIEFIFFAKVGHNSSNILSSLDFSYRNQEWGSDTDKINIHFGAESWFFNSILGFRLGVNWNEFSSGFSVRAPELFKLDVKLDYAFLWPMLIEETLGTHRVSMTYRF